MSLPDVQPIIESLSREHSAALLGWARGRFSDPRDAEEVVAETLARAWRHYDQFDRDRGTQRSWLFGIARNVAVDHHRRGQRHLRAVSTADMLDSGADDVELDRLVESSHVRDALDRLTPEHRIVVVEAYYQGRTTQQIAATHGIPAGTVKSRVFYAMKAMRAYLEEQGVLQ